MATGANFAFYGSNLALTGASLKHTMLDISHNPLAISKTNFKLSNDPMTFTQLGALVTNGALRLSTKALAIFYKGTPMSKAKNVLTVIGLILLAPILSLVGFFKFITVDIWGYFKHIGSSLSVMENGISASGQIVSIRQTNLWDGNRPVCEVEVKYIAQDGKTIRPWRKARSASWICRVISRAISPRSSTTPRTPKSGDRRAFPALSEKAPFNHAIRLQRSANGLSFIGSLTHLA